MQSIPVKDNTLIYFPTVVQIDSFIEETTTEYPALGLDNNPVLNEFITWGRREIHPQWSIIKALEKGFLVHHGQLPLGIRMLELSLFNNSSSNFTRLICTSTLLEGVNTTAKNIIITMCENYTLDDSENKGRQGLKNIGTFKGYYITDGKAIEIQCIKNARNEQTVYKDLNGKEIEVNDGNTFVNICPIDANLIIE